MSNKTFNERQLGAKGGITGHAKAAADGAGSGSAVRPGFGGVGRHAQQQQMGDDKPQKKRARIGDFR
ncbi:MAG: hypothetical protein EOO28_07255 [Comamonadaceae bacterium]|nr:MAG: hypothetical protein EOO28_07255 [Comamonadaceae bacterium]